MTTSVTAYLRATCAEQINAVTAGCTQCGECVRDCAFLQKYGTPATIAAAFDSSHAASLSRPFECSLCGLCTAICPEQLDLDRLFLEMRREAVDRGFGSFPEHAPLKTYERLGTSRRFTLYRLPEQCTTVFFPGCSLPGTRPEAVKQLFADLRNIDPALGIVFDCCLKPSHSLGREQYVEAMFAEMRDWLLTHGVREVLVACPNCQVMFETFGGSLQVRTAWELLAEQPAAPEQLTGTVTVHDPCVIRHSGRAQRAVRSLLERRGLTVEEMPHSGRTTLCCGQGGGVNLLDPDLTGSWARLRTTEADGRRLISYCAACVQTLGAATPASHLADLLYAPEQTLAGTVKGATAPFTYLNRLLLKRSFTTMKGSAVTRERTFVPEEHRPTGRAWKPLLLLGLLAAAITAVHLSGAGQYLQQDRLRALIEGYGPLAPAIYILIYALAPVLFLPGLPLTIAGGILFGPVWGVVYAITGATIGASLAFLVARYGARDWVAAKLTGPKWQKLDQEVARHGWKVVAFTRLIPAFPFNLLNYAFGLTSIPFPQYAVTSFLCMLPACIAFIVFSSSLPDLVRGKVSPAALLGLLLIAVVSLLPVVYRRWKKQPETASE